MTEWNPTQAAFYLLAAIIGVEVLLVVATYVLCAWFNITHPEAPTTCDGLKKTAYGYPARLYSDGYGFFRRAVKS